MISNFLARLKAKNFVDVFFAEFLAFLQISRTTKNYRFSAYFCYFRTKNAIHLQLVFHCCEGTW